MDHVQSLAACPGLAEHRLLPCNRRWARMLSQPFQSSPDSWLAKSSTIGWPAKQCSLTCLVTSWCAPFLPVRHSTNKLALAVHANYTATLQVAYSHTRARMLHSLPLVLVLTRVVLRGSTMLDPPGLNFIGTAASVFAASWVCAVLAPALLGIARVLILGEYGLHCECTPCIHVDCAMGCMLYASGCLCRQSNGLVLPACRSLQHVYSGCSRWRTLAFPACSLGAPCCPHGQRTRAEWICHIDDGRGPGVRVSAGDVGGCCNHRLPQSAKGKHHRLRYCCLSTCAGAPPWHTHS